MKSLEFRVKSLGFILTAILSSPAASYALDARAMVNKTAGIIGYAALIMGPGMGALLAFSGAMKLRKKEEDPREFSRGILYIVSGLICAVIGVVINAVLQYYGVGETVSVGDFERQMGGY